MANIIEKQYTFQNSTASSHFSKSGGMNLGQAGLVSNPLILWESNSGTATMNATGKSFLYPKAGIHPFKADYTFILWNGTDSNFTSSPSSYMNFYFKIDGNTIYHKEVAPGKTSSPSTASDAITDDTNPAILNSTSSSSIVFEITAQKNGLTQMCGISSTNDYQCFIKFYFQQWDLIGHATGEGIAGITCPGRLYDGETGIFTANLRGGAVWQGWYFDQAHTQLVSTDQTYTVTATQDLTLYAYASYDVETNHEDFYVKSHIVHDNWTRPKAFYLKTLNGWVKQTNSNILKENICNRFRSHTTIFRKNLTGINSNTIYSYIYEPYQHPIFLIDMPSNYYFKSWSYTAPSGQLLLYRQNYYNQIVLVHTGESWRSSSSSNITSQTYDVNINYFYYDNNNQVVEGTTIIKLKQADDSFETHLYYTPGFYKDIISKSLAESNNAPEDKKFFSFLVPNYNTIIHHRGIQKDNVTTNFLNDPQNETFMIEPNTYQTITEEMFGQNVGTESPLIIFDSEKNSTMTVIFNDLTYRQKTDASISYVEYRNGQPTGREFLFTDDTKIKNLNKGDSSIIYYLKLSDSYQE